MARFKVKTIIANVWAAMEEGYRQQLCAQGVSISDIGTRRRCEGKAIVLAWAGVDIAVVEKTPTREGIPLERWRALPDSLGEG
ncbi:hypothetical protein [Streptomyces vietnamensis]|uniref:Uncharacterized protein n=1 Tax=Streptomyces vietnamensis TaxID=362257 RepID=A0A0B5IID3_9ACTN|nr:hypothetical protein [Streptomyces vietnamensis]AJF68169.1 hypothetical protein SVTN_31200 [Streptomyces vietnamensis]